MKLLLDLFCGVGGAAKGYADAGFTPIGVDRYLQPNYPYPCLQLYDAPSTLRRLLTDPQATILGHRLTDFDVIHASPPCQKYSLLADRHWNFQYNDLLQITRELLQATNLPYVIENVEHAPMLKEHTIMLCGMFFHESHGVRVLRHRKFESNVPLTVEWEHVDRWNHPPVFTYDKRKNQFGQLDQNDPSTFITVTGGGNCLIDVARDAMTIPWAKTRDELNQAIPPAYTEYVGKQMMVHI